MNISIIGSGNIATYFAQHLFAEGHTIHQVFSPTLAHAELLAEQVNAQAVDDLSKIEKTVPIFLIAIKDDAFDCINQYPVFENKLLIHCSGTKSIHKFAPASANRGVIWPVYSIRKHDLPTISNLPLIVDYTNEETASVVFEMAKSISDNITQLNETQRRFLHLNAVFVNNFPNHLFAIAEQICIEQGVPYDILVPIIQQSFDNIAHGGFLQKQTGPAIRNDKTTIEKHIGMLDKHPSWQQLYKDITNSIIFDNNKL